MEECVTATLRLRYLAALDDDTELLPALRAAVLAYSRSNRAIPGGAPAFRSPCEYAALIKITGMDT